MTAGWRLARGGCGRGRLGNPSRSIISYDIDNFPSGRQSRVRPATHEIHGDPEHALPVLRYVLHPQSRLTHMVINPYSNPSRSPLINQARTIADSSTKVAVSTPSMGLFCSTSTSRVMRIYPTCVPKHLQFPHTSRASI